MFGRAGRGFAGRALQFCLPEKATEDVVTRRAKGDVIEGFFTQLAGVFSSAFENDVLRTPKTTGIGEVLGKVLPSPFTKDLVG